MTHSLFMEYEFTQCTASLKYVFLLLFIVPLPLSVYSDCLHVHDTHVKSSHRLTFLFRQFL